MLSVARWLTTAVLLTLLSGYSSARRPPSHSAAPDFGAIDAYIADAMASDRVPGVALAVVHGDRIVYARGYGDDGSGQPVTPQSGFILGSMSKAFTALAVMQLVERGVVALDVPVQRYVPWFRVADPAAAAQITVRHLLNHTSGIPTNTPQAQQAPSRLELQVRALAGVALRHPPGEVHIYSSANYLVLGAMIEQVSGQSYAEYIRQHVFAPLAMRSSFTAQATALEHGMARGHRYWFSFPVPATLAHEADRLPTASLISSAEDVGHFLVAQLNGGRFGDAQVVSPAGVAEMQRPAAPGDGFSYAMGWRVGPIRGVPAIHHGGIVPHFRGKMVLLPEHGYGVVVLTNVSTAAPLPLVPTSHRLADGIAGYLAGEPLPNGGSAFGWIYLAATAGMGLVVLNQGAALFRLGTWRAALATRRRRAVVLEVLGELAWPPLLVLVVPWLVGVPWSEIARSTPDLALWCAVLVGLGAINGVARAAAAWVALRSPAGVASHPARPALARQKAQRHDRS